MKPNSILPWLMLGIRSALFLGFQALIALIFDMAGLPESWNASASWWPISVVLTNLVCLGLLIRFYQQENKNFGMSFGWNANLSNRICCLYWGSW